MLTLKKLLRGMRGFQPKRAANAFGGWVRTRLLTRSVGIFLGFSVLSSAVLAVMALYISTLGYATGLFQSYFLNPLTLLFNFLPIFITVTVVAMLLHSLRLSVLINGLFWAALAAANIIKLSYRHANLKPEDFALLPPLVKILPHYMKDFDLTALWPVGAGLVLLIVFSRFMPKIKFHPISRMATVPILVGAGLLLVSTVYADTTLYKSQYIANEARWCNSDGITYRLHSDRYQANGLMYSFCYYSHYYLGPSNENYDEKNAEALDQRYGNEPIPEHQKVHVMTILLESFKDFTPQGMPSVTLQTPGGDPYAPFRALQQESLSGTMISDVYGGGTINIENGVLSGLYKMPNYVNHAGWSNVRYFYENGYRTIAMHPNDGYFYSRHDRYPNEGFENFLYTQNHFKNDLTKFMPDHVLMPDIKAVFDRYKVQGPTFLYAATMQGHGPYNETSLEGHEWFPYDPATSESAYYMLNNYFEGVYQTGQALQNLTASLNEEEEPVVVVLFGDHSPRLIDGAEEILGFSAEEGSPELKRNTYATPYVIWANDAAKALFQKDFKGSLPTIDPQQMISNVLFKYLGWHGSSYHAFLQDLGNSVTCQKNDFWTVDGIDTVIYPETKRQDLKNLTDLNLFYKRKNYDAVVQIDERSDDKRYETDVPATADPDSSENAATRALTGQGQGR